MNDQIKLLMAGAVVGIVGAVAGGIVVGWAMTKDERATAAQHTSSYRSQPASPFASSKFNPTTSRPNVLTTAIHRLPPATSPAFQKLQDSPEVKKAKEEYIEAQKKYVAAMQAVMGKPAASDGRRVTGDGNGGQKTAVSGQPAQK